MRRGFGLTQEVATRRALLRALKRAPKQFNAAELDSVLVTEYPRSLIVMREMANHWGLKPGGFALAKACTRMLEPDGQKYLQQWCGYRTIGDSVYRFKKEWSTGEIGKNEMPIRGRTRQFFRGNPCDRTPCIAAFTSLCVMIVGAGGTRSLIGVFLNQQPVFPFSPSAFQASLQTSIFQARDPTTGAAMSPIKRSDVKSHLHSPLVTKIHLVQPESQPDATGYSDGEPEAIKADPSGFAQDFVAEHSSSGVAVAPTDPTTGSIGQQAPAVSESAQT
ncbi:hypothetical protein SBA5_1100033 [Candidatus Sulfotelmatomonas gaucii]|uniref:Uncharacterized protein n=1 Tax=Candidatus Sulfuritelmatomonas gaucii TaxID=2043161 RepID=A0A2N9L3Y1_9BACT|nr:hypothetical protein SBA5_1100033 [Candidatus Sulfotelmatomonas gaucii]